MATDWASLKVPELKAELKRRSQPATGLKAELVARLVELEAASEPEVVPEQGSVELEPEDEVASQVESDVPQEAAVESHADEPASTTSSENNTSAKVTEHDANTVSTVQLPPSSMEPQEVLNDLTKRKRRSRSPPPSGNDTPRKRTRADEDLPFSNNEGGDPLKEIVTSQSDAQWVDKHNGVKTGDVSLRSDDDMHLDDTDKVEVSRPYEDSYMADTAIGDINAPVSPGLDKGQRFRELFDHSTSRDEEMHDVEIARADSERVVEPAVHAATSALYIRDFQRPLNPATLKEHLTILAAPPGSSPDASIILNFFLDPIRTHALVEFANTSAASRVRTQLHGTVWPDERNRKELWVDFIPQEKMEEWQAEEQGAPGGARSSLKWEVAYEPNPDADGEVIARLREASTVPALQQPTNTAPPKASMAPPTGPRGSGSNGFGFDGPQVQPPSGPRMNTFDARGSRGGRFEGSGGRPPPLFGPNIDQRVRTTEAEPRLNYQYVSKDLANKRLDNLDKATTRKPYDKNGPINRYSFDNGDMLIDRGQERFEGIRPPPGVIRRGAFRDSDRGGGGSFGRGYGGRGGFGGNSYRGGRGGYGGGDHVDSGRLARIDDYGQGRGDTWRNRDDGYEKRGGRDDGPRYRGARHDNYRDRRY